MMQIAPPLIADPALAARARDELGLDALATTEESRRLVEVAAAAFSAAPHLFRLARKRPETLAAIFRQGPASVLDDILTAARSAAAAPDQESLERTLRLAKADLHLSVGLGDLAGLFDLDATTGALTDFADAAVQSSLSALARLEGLPSDPERGAAPWGRWARAN
jgi:[glutamine synthetase] adenylyltransferase / [glutamine synthetase]-adenylyl-L-tyrosine phosphorylase